MAQFTKISGHELAMRACAVMSKYRNISRANKGMTLNKTVFAYGQFGVPISSNLVYTSNIYNKSSLGEVMMSPYENEKTRAYAERYHRNYYDHTAHFKMIISDPAQVCENAYGFDCTGFVQYCIFANDAFYHNAQGWASWWPDDTDYLNKYRQQYDGQIRYSAKTMSESCALEATEDLDDDARYVEGSIVFTTNGHIFDKSKINHTGILVSKETYEYYFGEQEHSASLPSNYCYIIHCAYPWCDYDQPTSNVTTSRWGWSDGVQSSWAYYATHTDGKKYLFSIGKQSGVVRVQPPSLQNPNPSLGPGYSVMNVDVPGIHPSAAYDPSGFYYFRWEYIGSFSKWLNLSDVMLDTPVPTFNTDYNAISWTAIPHAVGYEIKCLNERLGEIRTVSVTSTLYVYSDYVPGYSYTIRAIAPDTPQDNIRYYDSQWSKGEFPAGLFNPNHLFYNWFKSCLTWDAVPKAINYDVYNVTQNKTYETKISNTSCQIVVNEGDVVRVIAHPSPSDNVVDSHTDYTIPTCPSEDITIKKTQLPKIFLYESDALDFDNFGICSLSDATACKIKEERNGEYYLEMSYPYDNEKSKEIKNGRIVCAKPNPYDNYEPFRIYSIEKNSKKELKIKAYHLSYDLNGWIIKPASDYVDFTMDYENFINYFNNTTNAVVQNIDDTGANSKYKFNFVTKYEKVDGEYEDDRLNDYSIKVPRPYNLRAILCGNTASVLDIWKGDLKFVKWTIYHTPDRGSECKTSLRYRKNIKGITAKFNSSTAYSAIFPYIVKESNNGSSILYMSDSDGTPPIVPIVNIYNPSTGTYDYSLIDYSKILLLDISNEELPNGDAICGQADGNLTTEQYWAVCKNYIADNNLEVLAAGHESELDVDLTQINSRNTEYEEYADLESLHLCDTVTVHYEDLGINVKMKITETEYDALLDRYESVKLSEIVEEFKGTTSIINSSNKNTSNSGAITANTVRSIVSSMDLRFITGYYNSQEDAFYRNSDYSNDSMITPDSRNLLLDKNTNVLYIYGALGAAYYPVKTSGEISFDNLTLELKTLINSKMTTPEGSLGQLLSYHTSAGVTGWKGATPTSPLYVGNNGNLYLYSNSAFFTTNRASSQQPYYLDLLLDNRSLELASDGEYDLGLGVKLKQNGGIIFDGTDGLKLDTSSLVTSIGEKTGAIGLGTGLTTEQVGTTGVWKIKVNTSTIVSFTDLYNLRYMADPNTSQYGYYHSFNEEGSKQFEWISSIPASGINYGNGLTSNAGQLVVDTDVIQTKIPANTYAAYSHNHDGRYYTETEVNTLLNSKLNIPNLSGSGATQPVYWNNTTKQFYLANSYPTTLPASDVYQWAKAATKPSYSLSEISGFPAYGSQDNKYLFVGSGELSWVSKPSYSWNEIGSKPSFHAVATSGSYNDLSNKPIIPTVNNAALKFYGNSTQVASFSANASVPADLYIKSGTGISIATGSGEITINCTVTDTDTHRPIKVDGYQKLGNDSTPLDICAGDNITLSYNATTNKLWIASTGGGSLPMPEGANRILISQDNGSGTEYEWVQETKANLLSGLMPKSGGSFTGVVKFNPGDGNCIVFDANTTFTINQNGGATLIGTNGSANWIGLRTADTQIRGSQARPKYYQGNTYRGELALLSDTISYSQEGIHAFENSENRADGVIATFRSSGTTTEDIFIGLGNGNNVYGYYGSTSGGYPVFKTPSGSRFDYLATESWVSENFIPWTCLIEGTKIKMFDGTEKNIEDIKTGDSILTYDLKHNTNIEGVVIGASCTGSTTDYDAYIFENGTYVELFGEHSMYDVETNCLKQNSKWTLGEHCLSSDIQPQALVSVDNVHHPIYKRHYVLITNNNLYYANGLLLGHWSATKYNYIVQKMSHMNFPAELLEQYKQESLWNDKRHTFAISPENLAQSSTILANLRSLTKESDALKESLNQSDYTVTKVAEEFFGKLKAMKLWTIGNLKDAFEAIKDFDYTDRDTIRKRIEALEPQIIAAKEAYTAIKKTAFTGLKKPRSYFRRSSNLGNQNVAQIKEWANSLKGENET